MKLSVKSDYAARAVLGLARKYTSGQAVRVEDLGKEQGIPPKYLVQILIELKGQGIVRSIRGKEGGYLLGRAPVDITLADVLKSVDGEIFGAPALTNPDCPAELRQAWEKLQTSIEASAKNINFQQLLDTGLEKEKMYYI